MDEFTIHIHGVGGHAARPNVAIDPIVVGSLIVLALLTVVARRVSPLDSAVLSIRQFHAGTTDNVIPSTAFLNGTIRWARWFQVALFVWGRLGRIRAPCPFIILSYDFNDDILPIGASVWAALVEQELPRV